MIGDSAPVGRDSFLLCLEQIADRQWLKANPDAAQQLSQLTNAYARFAHLTSTLQGYIDEKMEMARVNISAGHGMAAQEAVSQIQHRLGDLKSQMVRVAGLSKQFSSELLKLSTLSYWHASGKRAADDRDDEMLKRDISRLVELPDWERARVSAPSDLEIRRYISQLFPHGDHQIFGLAPDQYAARLREIPEAYRQPCDILSAQIILQTLEAAMMQGHEAVRDTPLRRARG